MMFEQFRPAGHKAPSLTTAIALEESFKPIQRVVRNNETMGYLFRDVEYRRGHVDDVVLANDAFRSETLKSTDTDQGMTFQLITQDDDKNQYGFRIPSGPLMMELTYRAAQDKTKLQTEIATMLHATYQRWPAFNTTIQYSKNIIHHTHHDGTTEPQQMVRPENHRAVLSDDIASTTQTFLTALFGRRAAHARTILGTRGAPIVLCTAPQQEQTDECALMLGVNKSGSTYIYANKCLTFGSACEVADAKTILNLPGVEVRDD